jgi:hypothetical protein
MCKNYVYQSLKKTLIIRNLYIINKEYISALKKIWLLSSQYRFILVKFITKLKGWQRVEFGLCILPLRKEFVIWLVKKANSNPYYYFIIYISDFGVENLVGFINKY